MPGSREWRVKVDTDEVGVVFEPAPNGGHDLLFVFAHGAGGHMADRGMVALAGMLRDLGLAVVRFNFPYREKGSSRPDPMPRLEACIAEVVARARRELAPARLLIGGRSMGGRAASMLAARSFACDGLLLFAYPLHPAGQPDKRRDAHLARIAVPTLCINGTRDPLCRQDIMDAVVGALAVDWRMHWLDGADHSFHVRRASVRTDREVLEEMGAATRAWMVERHVGAAGGKR